MIDTLRSSDGVPAAFDQAAGQDLLDRRYPGDPRHSRIVQVFSRRGHDRRIADSGMVTSMTHTLNRRTRPDDYERDGVVTVSAVLNAADLAEVRSTFMDQVERDRSLGHDDGVPTDDPLAAYPRFVQPHRHEDTPVGRLARRLMMKPEITAVVEQLIGPFFGAQSMFYFKPPGARGQALHQDNLFLRAHPETCLAAWVAIDDVDAQNGGLAVVPGSHRSEIVCPEPADQSQSFTSEAVAVPAGMSAVAPVLAAGDALFFHGGLVHGSGPNASPTRFRRSLIFHYVPQTSREIAAFYLPLVAPAGPLVNIDCKPLWSSRHGARHGPDQ